MKHTRIHTERRERRTGGWSERECICVRAHTHSHKHTTYISPAKHSEHSYFLLYSTLKGQQNIKLQKVTEIIFDSALWQSLQKITSLFPRLKKQQ